MGVEKALVSSITIVLVAMWSPIDFYIFSDPQFSTKQECVEYVMENQRSLQTYLIDEFDSPPNERSTFYCVDSETLKNALSKQNKPKI